MSWTRCTQDDPPLWMPDHAFLLETQYQGKDKRYLFDMGLRKVCSFSQNFERFFGRLNVISIHFGRTAHTTLRRFRTLSRYLFNLCVFQRASFKSMFAEIRMWESEVGRRNTARDQHHTRNDRCYYPKVCFKSYTFLTLSKINYCWHSQSHTHFEWADSIFAYHYWPFFKQPHWRLVSLSRLDRSNTRTRYGSGPAVPQWIAFRGWTCAGQPKNTISIPRLGPVANIRLSEWRWSARWRESDLARYAGSMLSNLRSWSEDLCLKLFAASGRSHRSICQVSF